MWELLWVVCLRFIYYVEAASADEGHVIISRGSAWVWGGDTLMIARTPDVHREKGRSAIWRLCYRPNNHSLLVH